MLSVFAFKIYKVCLLICLGPQEHFSSYLTAVTNTGDKAANFDLCLALTAVSSEGSFTFHT
jgi:hypothetical protein